jgi:hypothetical protein
VTYGLSHSTIKTCAGALGEESAANVPRRFVETEYHLICSGAPEYTNAQFIVLNTCRSLLVVAVIFESCLKIGCRLSSAVCCSPGTLVFLLLWIGCLIGFPLWPTSINSDLLKLPPWATLLPNPRVGLIVRGVAREGRSARWRGSFRETTRANVYCMAQRTDLTAFYNRKGF